MAKTQDYTKIMQEMMSSFPMDRSKLQESFKSQAAFGEKMARIALDAAGKSTDLCSKWTKDTLSRAGELSSTKAEPTDYAKAMSAFTSSAAEMAAENMAAFAEIAKKVQMDTVEVMMAAGKDVQEEASNAVKKATDEVTAATSKGAAAAK